MYLTPQFDRDALLLDPETTQAVEHAMVRLFHALSYEKRTGKSFAGSGLLDRLMSPDIRCLFTAFPDRGNQIWNLINDRGWPLHLDYKASPVGFHDGEWCFARFMTAVKHRVIYATPASRFKKMKIIRNGQEELVESPHQSIEQCLLHELSHIAGAKEAEAVLIGNSTPSFTDLKLEIYDATWLGELPGIGQE